MFSAPAAPREATLPEEKDAASEEIKAEGREEEILVKNRNGDKTKKEQRLNQRRREVEVRRVTSSVRAFKCRRQTGAIVPCAVAH